MNYISYYREDPYYNVITYTYHVLLGYLLLSLAHSSLSFFLVISFFFCLYLFSLLLSILFPLSMSSLFSILFCSSLSLFFSLFSLSHFFNAFVNHGLQSNNLVSCHPTINYFYYLKKLLVVHQTFLNSRLCFAVRSLDIRTSFFSNCIPIERINKKKKIKKMRDDFED